MTRDGLQRMFEFTDFLRDRNVEYRIDQPAPDELMVTFTLVGIRGEVTFDVDGSHYCLFKGSESVQTDFKPLLDLIDSQSKQ